MKLVSITENVFIDPTEVCSVQAEQVKNYTSGSISDHTMHVTFDGSIITLKNGRKIAVDKFSPQMILDKLK